MSAHAFAAMGPGGLIDLVNSGLFVPMRSVAKPRNAAELKVLEESDAPDIASVFTTDQEIEYECLMVPTPGIKQLIFYKKPLVIPTRATFMVGGGPNFALRSEYADKMMRLHDVVSGAMKQLAMGNCLEFAATFKRTVEAYDDVFKIKRENGGMLGTFDAINPFDVGWGMAPVSDSMMGSANGKCVLMALRDVIAPHVTDECWGIPAAWRGEWRAEKVFRIEVVPGQPMWYCGLKVMKNGI